MSHRATGTRGTCPSALPTRVKYLKTLKYVRAAGKTAPPSSKPYRMGLVDPGNVVPLKGVCGLVPHPLLLIGIGKEMKPKINSKLVIVFLFLIIPTITNAKDYGNTIVSEVTSIYDADTFRVTIKGWPEVAGEHIPVRIKDIDAPEIRGKCQAEKAAARKAKQFTVDALRSAKVIELKNMERGKYFRILANVYVDSKNLADALISAGHARPYDGGTRGGWCKTE